MTVTAKLRIQQGGLTLVCAALVAAALVFTAGTATVSLSVVSGVAWLMLFYVLSRRIDRARRMRDFETDRVPKPARTPVDELESIDERLRSFIGDTPVDGETASDLDLDEIHTAANYTLSLPGEAVLYSIMRNMADSKVVNERTAVIEFFRHDNQDSMAVLRRLQLLGRDRSQDVGTMLFKGLPSKDPYYPVYIVQSVTTIVLIVLLLFGFTSMLVPLVVVLLVNLLTYFRSAYSFQDVLPRLTQLLLLTDTADRLSTNRLLSGISPWKRSRRSRSFRVLKALAQVITFAPTGAGDILSLLQFYTKVLLLLDALVYRPLLKLAARNIGLLRDAYVFVGSIDALQALSAFKHRMPYSCKAEIVEAKRHLSAVAAYHPLLDQPAANDIILHSPGMILTGANMSGKSTFLRTVCLNALLARTVGFCAARSFEVSPFRIVTLIRKSDSVTGGSSTYFYEARRIYEMIGDSAASDSLLFAVDEFFSGTNSRERIAAATAVLRFLVGRGCITIAATHDLEIARRLSGEYDLSHFADRVSGDEILFDYILNPGIIRSTNGIRLLRAIGYPGDIVDSAHDLAGLPGIPAERHDGASDPDVRR